MNRLLQGLLPLSLLVLMIGGSRAFAHPSEKTPAGKSKSIVATAKSPSLPQSGGLDSLCRNHYNALHLKVGKFEQIKAIIDADKKAGINEIKTNLNARNVTLEEASWGLYYLGQKSLAANDFKHFVNYLTIAAEDYLNPWAMTLLAKVYFYDKAAWKKQFPAAEITTDKDLERSFTYLTLAFVISGEIEKDHQDNFLLTGVTNGGLALKDTFEGTGVSGFDTRKTLQKHQKDLLEKAEAYKKLYEKGR